MIKAEHKNNAVDVARARGLRKSATRAEHEVWNALKTIPDIKFRRQQPIHPYIVDFACMKAKLVIEIDGFSHDVNVGHDVQRSIYLNNLGYKVLRFSNDDVSTNLEGLVATIEAVIKERWA